MNMTKNKTGYAIFAAALLMLFGEESLSAAQGAVYRFWKSFLPAMLPFFLLSPYLTGPDAQALFSRLLGHLFPFLFRVPGRAAGAALCGLCAGSPAGANACAGLRTVLDEGEYRRACFLASGLSPGFLITAIGSGYLADPASGAVLFAAHTGALLLGGVLLRGYRPKDGAGEGNRERAPESDLFLQALGNLGRVLCWMVAFGVLCALLERWLSPVVPGWLLAPVCEISAGAAALAAAPIPPDLRLVLLSACTGFGGVCVLLQNAHASRIPVRVLLPVKLLHALLSAALSLLLVRLPSFSIAAFPQDLLAAAAVSALALSLAVFLYALQRKNRVDARP